MIALTAREEEVVRLVARGLSDKQLGAALGLSPFTVRNHLRIAREKTGHDNRTQLALWAIASGLVPAPTCEVWQ